MTTLTDNPDAALPEGIQRYGDASGHSYFRDMARQAASKQRREAAFEFASLRGDDPGDPEPNAFLAGRLEDALKRLEMSQKRDRAFFDITSSAGSGLTPSSATLTAETNAYFQAAARNAARVAGALGSNPVPDDTGLTVGVAKMTTGATVAIQATQNNAVSNTDPGFGLVTNAIGYAAGYIDVSNQLLDRAGPGTAGKLDKLIALELGRAAGERVDAQVLNGAGSSGETLGLLNASGIDTTTYTSASPTVAELVSKLGSSYAAASTAFGSPPDVAIIHPTRLAWLASQAAGGDDAARRILSLYDRVIEAPTVPTTINTDQAPIISLNSAGVHLFVDPVVVEAFPEVKSGNLETRFRALVRVAVVVPQGAAVSKLLGTGLVAAPTFA